MCPAEMRGRAVFLFGSQRLMSHLQIFYLFIKANYHSVYLTSVLTHKKSLVPLLVDQMHHYYYFPKGMKNKGTNSASLSQTWLLSSSDANYLKFITENSCWKKTVSENVALTDFTNDER